MTLRAFLFDAPQGSEIDVSVCSAVVYALCCVTGRSECPCERSTTGGTLHYSLTPPLRFRHSFVCWVILGSELNSAAFMLVRAMVFDLSYQTFHEAALQRFLLSPMAQSGTYFSYAIFYESWYIRTFWTYN